MLFTSNKLYGNYNDSIKLLFPNSAVWVEGHWADCVFSVANFSPTCWFRKKPPIQYVRCEMEGCGTVLAHPRYLQVSEVVV